ncbi:MAG: phosphoserine phosphatase SerB [Myxococcales bacterium]|nr:phosphoserine phosphatase SerB [Myxococcales bacterium]
MIPQPYDQSVLITITGRDRPGITAAVMSVLAQDDTEIVDIDQEVFDSYLIINLKVRLQGDNAVLKELLWRGKELGIEIDFRMLDPVQREVLHDPYAITLIGEQITASLIAELAGALTFHGHNIEKIFKRGEWRQRCFEFVIDNPGGDLSPKLKAKLLTGGMRWGVDIAIQHENRRRYSRRFVIMDMDSTLIQQEVIVELAKEAGKGDEVHRITEEAMAGKLDFDESLRLRVQALAGLDVAVLERVKERLTLTPGAETLAHVLRTHAYKLAVVSGGFTPFVEYWRERLGLHYAFANELEIVDGRLSGRVLGRIVNREAKAAILRELAFKEQINPDDVIAIGDGANDIDMIVAAGLGIAFNAKGALREKADYSYNQRSLDSLLYLLGFKDKDIRIAEGEVVGDGPR